MAFGIGLGADGAAIIKKRAAIAMSVPRVPIKILSQQFRLRGIYLLLSAGFVAGGLA